jgi:cobalt-zinc-cadmium efflux system protein
MHAHAPGRDNTPRVLRISSFVTLAYVVLLVVAGVRAHSLALLSEAGHNVSDFLALLLSLAAVYIAERPPSKTKTYGYRRAEVLAAFINSAALVLIAFYIFYQAFHRLYAPREVHAGTMIWVGATGVVMNAVIALLLYRHSDDLNVRSAFLHEIGDTLSTAAVIGGAIAIKLTGRYWIDPALSVGIGAFILWSSLGIIWETLNILLEGIPRGMDLRVIEGAMLQIEGINSVHDLHVWSLGSATPALSCHIAIADIPLSACEGILREVNDVLGRKFHIHHTTIQFEHAVCGVAAGCIIPNQEPHTHAH